MKLLVVLGSVRKGRAGIKVANWFLPIAQEEFGEVDFADLKEADLPLDMDITIPSAVQNFEYASENTRAWSERVRAADAVVFITPEYNHAVTAPMKNAIDQIYSEWFGKPVGFVGYGSRGAVDAIKSLDVTAITLKWDVVDSRVAIEHIDSAFDDEGHLNNAEEYEKSARDLLKSLSSRVQ